MRSLLSRRPVLALLLVGAISCNNSSSACRQDPWADDVGNKGQPATTWSNPSGGPDHTAVASGNLNLVDDKRLEAFLPALSGWTQESPPRGDTDPTENVSRVQVTYREDGGTGGLSVEIMDTMGNRDMLEPLIRYIRANSGKQIVESNATGVTPQEVKGFPAKQEWNADQSANNGTLSLLLVGRFTVGITGNSLANSQKMKFAAASMDLKKLSELK